MVLETEIKQSRSRGGEKGDVKQEVADKAGAATLLVLRADRIQDGPGREGAGWQGIPHGRCMSGKNWRAAFEAVRCPATAAGEEEATAAGSGQRPPQPRGPPANAFAMPASKRQY